MKQLFLTLLRSLWNLTTPDVEPMGKNRAMRLMLAKAEREHSAKCLSVLDPSSTGFYNYGGRLAPAPPREGYPDQTVRAEYFSYEGELK